MGTREGGGYGTADVLGGSYEHTGGNADPPLITVPASPSAPRHRLDGRPHPAADHPGPSMRTGPRRRQYPLIRHATHPTTAHAAEESPG
ncbi:hypothetical protein SHJG_6791 [Streptomyces hygroscopicus subsp. jinggangensis 5008]|nr:hypothetical protein SHJG_6791 [Streptomyces hygroscopicus subsp. jinggangensis 5008]AGF66214.1 hypothetical protein SHJGH_6551 [Streptomyces hygroscopicus subsp. jinggangensis TL01]